MKKILFVDACIRGNESRTKIICERLIESLSWEKNVIVEKVVLEKEAIPYLDLEKLKYRKACCETKDFSDSQFDYARQFACADIIIIGAPYWDLSFPAVLKNYLEMTSICGIAYTYEEDGVAVGLCQAEELFYITTSGGFIGDNNFGYDYVKGLCQLYGIEKVKQIKAEGLDIKGFDSEALIKDALVQIEVLR